MLPTGMRLTNRTDTSGKGDTTLARWTSRTSGGVALYRAQSGESRVGLGGEAVASVQRSLSLRRQRARRVFDAGAVAQPLDQHNLAEVPQRRGDGSEVGRHSPTHAYWPAPGHWGIYSGPREGNVAPDIATEARTTRKDRHRSKAR